MECRASPAPESTYNIPPSTSSATCRKKRRKIGRREAIKFIKIISFPGYLPEQGENFLAFFSPRFLAVYKGIFDKILFFSKIAKGQNFAPQKKSCSHWQPTKIFLFNFLIAKIWQTFLQKKICRI
jgi:hypothetical protein